MRALQTINSMNPRLGGPSSCTYDLMQGLHEIGANVDLLTVRCRDTKAHNLGEGCSWLKEVENDCWTPLELSQNLTQALRATDYEVYHANTLWKYQSHITCKMAREKGRPYIMSAHGMLYPNALQMKHWKKQPMLWMWYDNDIQKASCLHATCKEEMEHYRAFGYKGPIAVIPNAVVIPQDVERASTKPDGKKQIGFLGRLHPIKKVENVLYAIAQLATSERSQLVLKIMGKFDDGYERFLRDEVNRLDLGAEVEFLGFVSGKEKYDILKDLTALFVPSESENFGMIVPEALICGTPVYASLGTPWEELNQYGCGWWRDNKPETIAGVIREILAYPNEEIIEMGHRGRSLIEEKYGQHKVAAMMLDLYEWITGNGAKPSFVFE